jgi:hypothetical protein
MNELLKRRHIKSVMKNGIPKNIATDIVEHAMMITDGGKGDNLELIINYAIDLTYNLGKSVQTSQKFIQ